MLAVTGYRTTIVREMMELVPEDKIIRMTYQKPILNADRYLFAAGILHGKRLEEYGDEEAWGTFCVNFLDLARACEEILDVNKKARICIIGSESGISGSYDQVYAASKRAVHGYVETRKVGQDQQLVAIAPHIIENAGMTERRTDYENLARKRGQNRKRRFLDAAEVARMAKFLLYDDLGYTTNTVIRMNGGGSK